MNKLVQAIEQTEFLLQKQEESQAFCMEHFNDLLTTIAKTEKTLESEGDAQNLAKLGEIEEYLSSYSSNYAEEIEEDIAFLASQLDALKNISAEKNETKKNELLDLMLDGRELPDTTQFKKEIEDDVESSKEEFLAATSDFKYAIEEGNFDELLAYLQELASEESVEVEDEDLEDDEEDEDEEDEGSSFDLFGCCDDSDSKDEKSSACCGGKYDCGNDCVCNEDCACEK